MAALAAALAVVLILTVISLRADREFAGRRHLPMSFGPSASGWQAPRRQALAVSPVLALAVLTTLALFGPDPVLPRVIVVGLAFIAAHLWHLRLCRRA